MPISVCIPVEITMAIPAPPDTVVLENIMLVLPWRTVLVWLSSSSSKSLHTSTLSPVSADWLMRTVGVSNFINRESAGTRSPVVTRMMSPGTNSLASTFYHSPARSTRASSLCKSLSASSADSALDSYHTPTIALAVKINKITNGST